MDNGIEEKTSLLTESDHPLLNEDGNKLLITQSDIPEPDQKTVTVRQSGYLSEQLSFSRKKAEDVINKNRDVLRDILEREGGKLLSESISIEDIGVRLEPSGHRLLNAFTCLLHDKSENENVDSESFYMGNDKTEVVSFGGYERKAPRIRISENELIKEYLGRDKYSGKDQINLKKVIKSVAEKLFTITIEQKVTDKKGKETTISIIDNLPLFRVQEINEYDGRREYLISLNPIYVEQIQSKYVLLPRDLNRRISTVIPHGNAGTEAVYILLNYLLHQCLQGSWSKDDNAYITEINEETLLSKLKLDKHIKKRQPKRAKEGLNGAIQATIAMGICRGCEELEGAKGQKKYRFIINKNYPALEQLKPLP